MDRHNESEVGGKKNQRKKKLAKELTVGSRNTLFSEIVARVTPMLRFLNKQDGKKWNSCWEV